MLHAPNIGMPCPDDRIVVGVGKLQEFIVTTRNGIDRKPCNLVTAIHAGKNSISLRASDEGYVESVQDRRKTRELRQVEGRTVS